MTEQSQYWIDRQQAEREIRAEWERRINALIDHTLARSGLPGLEERFRADLVETARKAAEPEIQETLAKLFGDGSHQPLGIIYGADYGTADHNSWRPKAHFYGHEYYSLRPEYRKPGRRNWMR